MRIIDSKFRVFYNHHIGAPSVLIFGAKRYFLSITSLTTRFASLSSLIPSAQFPQYIPNLMNPLVPFPLFWMYNVIAVLFLQSGHSDQPLTFSILLAIANQVIRFMTTITMKNKTTVSLSEETKKHLEKFGKKGESFDLILQRVMKNTGALCNKQPQNDDVDAEEEE